MNYPVELTLGTAIRCRIRVAALLIAFAASSFAAPAQDKGKAPKPTPDVLVFTNGDQLTGTLERGVGNSVVFKSDMAGEITVAAPRCRTLPATSAPNRSTVGMCCSASAH